MSAVSKADAAAMKATIDSLPWPKRTGKPALIEWFCKHCDHWYIWPHSAPPPTRLRMQFQWRCSQVSGRDEHG